MIIAAAGSAGGFAYLTSQGAPLLSAAIISICGGLLLAGLLILGSDECIGRLQKSLAHRPLRIIAIISALFGLYAVYAAGTGTMQLQSQAGMAAYLSVPFLLMIGVRGRMQPTWQDAATILWLWLPIELGIVRRILLSTTPDTDFHYGFAQGLAINTGIIAFAAWRGFPDIGYRFELNRKIVSAALRSFLIYAALAIPLGLAIHFIRYSFEVRKLVVAPAVFLGVFLLTAIPEEFLFRGLIQNTVERITKHRSLGLVVASIIFGASHLNNGPPIPNSKYFVMASIAGIFYGLTWQRTGSLTASAITHAFVNTAWSVFFR
jgi:membrane protease YdiL (CAAX protease family)